MTPLAQSTEPSSTRLPANALALALVGTLAALSLTMIHPSGALLVGPLVLGVPHLLGDLWVLLRRPAASRDLARFVAAPLLGLVALRGAGLAGFTYPAWVEVVLGTGAVLLGAASTRSATRVFLVALACTPAWLAADHVALVLGHLHNAVAVALLVAWGPRAVGLAVLGATAAGLAAIGGGLLDGRLVDFGPLHPAELVAALAPDVAAPWGERLVLSYAFAQLVHYLAWVALLPACLRDAGATARRPYLAALRADLGGPLVGAGLLASVGLPLAGMFDPAGVRTGYLSLVLFHGWLELAAVAAFRARGEALPA